ncbi:DNA polymerase alpha subunit B [Nematocida parisii]|nr:DNA polymerase alpha subunit B [Nematocida parisii]KAI5128909.1 DNA polymerase alpha subunit B [Nematocida parisii]KAI5141562.1 DNA polymerase alpha subunit B [Nematocida parisii]
MDRVEELSRRLVEKNERVSEMGVLSVVQSKHKFLPVLTKYFYAYVRRRLEALCGTDYAINTRESTEKEIYCGMIMYANNAYYLLSVRADYTATVLRLDLAELPEYTIYPGQIIKVLGTNIIGEEVVADSLVYDREFNEQAEQPLPGKFLVSVIDMKRLESLKTTGETRDTHESERLLSLVNECCSDVLIIFGDVTVREREVCKSLAISKRIRIVCVPYTDGLESSMTYPTEYINRVTSPLPVCNEDEGTGIRGMCDISKCWFIELQNPCMISLNGVLIGLTTVDVLMGISRKEISRNREDRMYDILVHSVYQGTFLPFVPQDIPVDYSGFNAFLWPYRPDLYIFPTCLSARIESVCDTYVIPVCTANSCIEVNCSMHGLIEIVQN